MTRDKWRAILESGRVSNLPTTLSNATAGFFLGGGSITQDPVSWVGAVLATACLYEGGMFLNDICDFKTDRLERPTRPLPSGRLSRREAIWIAIGLFLGGILAVALFLPKAMGVALSLLGLILFYNFTHVWFPLSPLVMGCCRGGVYLLAAVAGGWKGPSELILGMAGTLTVYISAVSFIARHELKNTLTWIHPLNAFILVIALFLPMTLPTEGHPVFWVALVFGLSWIVQTGVQLLRKRLYPMPAVGRILAGMSLLDAIVLAKVGSVLGVFISWACFLGARLWQKRIQST